MLMTCKAPPCQSSVCSFSHDTAVLLAIWLSEAPAESRTQTPRVACLAATAHLICHLCARTLHVCGTCQMHCHMSSLCLAHLLSCKGPSDCVSGLMEGHQESITLCRCQTLDWLADLQRRVRSGGAQLACGNLVSAKFREVCTHDTIVYLNGLIHEDVIPLPQRSAALHICGDQRGILAGTCIGAPWLSCEGCAGARQEDEFARTRRFTLLECLLPSRQAIIEVAMPIPGGLMDLTK